MTAAGLPGTVHLRQVATLYAEAAAAGSRTTSLDIAAALQISRGTADGHVLRARRAGLIPPAPGPRAVADPVVIRYLDWMRQRGYSAQETIPGRRRSLARIADALAPVQLADATRADLADWRAALTVTGPVVIRYVSHLRAFYTWCIEDAGIRADNPAARIPVPREPRRKPRPISEDDLTAALRHAPPRIRAWLVLAAWCGLRCKEIALLRRENIMDTARPPVLLVAADATKGRSERVVPLSTFVLAEILPVLPASGWAFGRADGKPGPNSPSRISQAVGDYFRSQGITATPHMGRHRFATGTWAATHDLRLVQELMGHMHPSTTAGYCAWDQASAAAAVEALPGPAPRTPAIPATPPRGCGGGNVVERIQQLAAPYWQAHGKGASLAALMPHMTPADRAELEALLRRP